MGMRVGIMGISGGRREKRGGDKGRWMDKSRLGFD
jgi:hypothetical protein